MTIAFFICFALLLFRLNILVQFEIPEERDLLSFHLNVMSMRLALASSSFPVSLTSIFFTFFFLSLFWSLHHETCGSMLYICIADRSINTCVYVWNISLKFVTFFTSSALPRWR